MQLSRKQRQAFIDLQKLVASGVEFPDAVLKASDNGKIIHTSTLIVLYDEWCTSGCVREGA